MAVGSCWASPEVTLLLDLLLDLSTFFMCIHGSSHKLVSSVKLQISSFSFFIKMMFISLLSYWPTSALLVAAELLCNYIVYSSNTRPCHYSTNSRDITGAWVKVKHSNNNNNIISFRYFCVNTFTSSW